MSDDRTRDPRDSIAIEDLLDQYGAHLAERHPRDVDAGLAWLHASLAANPPAGFITEDETEAPPEHSRPYVLREVLRSSVREVLRSSARRAPRVVAGAAVFGTFVWSLVTLIRIIVTESPAAALESPFIALAISLATVQIYLTTRRTETPVHVLRIALRAVRGVSENRPRGKNQ